MKSHVALLSCVLLGCSAATLAADSTQAQSTTSRILRVANDGLDTPTCGARLEACRSISQAIRLASPGDEIIVGEGRYGDLNRNGVPGEYGEEAAPTACFCLIDVNNALTIRSSAGALQTILDGAGTPRSVVAITASFVRFGAEHGGFLVTGSSRAGIEIAAEQGVVVVGNAAEANSTQDGFGDGFRVTRGQQHRLTGNLAAGNGRGFALFGRQLTISTNVAQNNASGGFEGEGSRYLLWRNVANGNENGFNLAGPDHYLARSAAIGNRLFGIIAARTQPGNPATARFQVREPNIFGNNTAQGSPQPNCGLYASGTAVVATNNYWGTGNGPGADPADFACALDGEVRTEPFSSTRFSVLPNTGLNIASVGTQ